MIQVTPIEIEGHPFIATEMKLPSTNLLIVHCSHGYAMCGALDIGLLRDKLASRGIVAVRAVGVKTMDELLNGSVESCTQAAEELGIQPGTPIRDALLKMARSS